MGSTGADALLIVDVQNDFCAGGALPVPDGDAVVPVINRVARRLAARGCPIFASRDWHPRDSRHFATHGGPWPVHCVQGTTGAQFHPGLDLPDRTAIVTKGDLPDDHGYSAFSGHLADRTPLATALTARRVRRLAIAGLATDYCVRQSALDACEAGFHVILLTDGIRGVEVRPGDSERAIRDMTDAGVELGRSQDLVCDTVTGGN